MGVVGAAGRPPRSMLKVLLSWLAAAVLASASAAPVSAQNQSIKSPAQWLGHPLGADRELADWDSIVAYSHHLSEQSDRVDVVELGRSTLGKPFIVVILGSAESVAERDHLQELVRQLYTVAETDSIRARELARQGKVIVALSLGLHAIEVGASQASMEIMYEFATRDDARMRSILDNCLVLMVPSMNPDGLDIVADWYAKTVGTEAEGSPPPWLYHHYAGHDNNRDGFFNNLKETSLWSRLIYEDWLPQIILDEHQMGSSGPRLFLPPFDDPISATVHPLVYSQLAAAGQQMLSELTAEGHRGITNSTMFTAEWPGSVRSTGFWHNMLGLLSEVASARIATPLYFAPGSLHGGGRGLPAYARQSNFLDPWPGGWWRLRDIITLQKDLSFSLLAYAAREKEQLLFNFYRMNADAVRRGQSEAPFGFVVGADQHDEGAAHRLAELLLDEGIQLRWLDGPAEVAGRRYPRGAYLIDAAQPFRPFLMEMLDPPSIPPGERVRTRRRFTPTISPPGTCPRSWGCESNPSASLSTSAGPSRWSDPSVLCRRRWTDQFACPPGTTPAMSRRPGSWLRESKSGAGRVPWTLPRTRKPGFSRVTSCCAMGGLRMPC